ncbi:MAG: DEAD/DEAH box helicase [Lentisphaeria bacterium]|nr:DEAD/DEAH box helicase [Lentisphaeria bacterium]
MFEFVKKLLGIGTQMPEKEKNFSGKKKKSAPSAAEKGKNKDSRSRNRSASPKGEGKKHKLKEKSRTVCEESSFEAPVVKVPHPEGLREVPPSEGKMRFLDLPLHDDVQYGVQHAGFEYCTPIQAMTLPAVLEGRDIAGKAQTGTGKTAAFLLGGFTMMLNKPRPAEVENGSPRMLVLAPTRELAMQIHKDALELGVFTGLTSVVVFGGMDHEKQRKKLLQPIDLLVGTPGRVIDYCRNGDLKLKNTEILVIDEADRMLDMGFIPDIKRIVYQLPPRGVRQTMLFSATLEESILRLSSGWLTEPAVIESEPEKLVSENIDQTFYSVSRDEKLGLLLHLLKNREYERVIIFGNRKDVNLKLQYDLARYGFQVPVLSGDIPQMKRISILEKFRSGEEKIVIATDVAARGIHVDDVSLVINYDLPERSEDYIHRIGRTGRAGRRGVSVSFLCEYGAYYLPAIEELLGVTFPSELPTEEMVALPEAVAGAKLPERPRRENHSRRPSSGRGRSFRRRDR